MSLEDFYNLVANYAGISRAEAEQVTRHVLNGLNNTLGTEIMSQVRAELPSELFQTVPSTAIHAGDELVDFQTFIGPLMNDLDTEYLYDHNLGGMDLVSVYLDQEAVERSRAVFSALRQTLSSQNQELIRSKLSDEILQWWDESGQ